MENKNISYLNASSIELHYWFKDESHTMDAVIQNNCEYELLSIIKEIALTLNCEIIIETEPLAEGGIKRWFKIVAVNESKKAIITTSIITSFAIGIVVTPITSVLSEMSKVIIEKIFKDEEIKKLEKDKIIAEIENIKLDTELKLQQLSNNKLIVKKRSNFYEQLEKCEKIVQISIIAEDNKKQKISDEKLINRVNFKEFIIVSDEINPIIIDNAIIEIISPVLKKGNYKWRGIYNGNTYSFNMKSNEFKTLVQTGNIEFKNGSSVNCVLEIERKINNYGEEEITNYNILRVNEYFENDKPIETPEGRRYRQKTEGEKRQLSLIDNDEFINE